MDERERDRIQRQEERLARLRERGLGPDALTSLEQESLSIRHASANGLTPDGNIERLGLEAQMARTPGWRHGRVLRWILTLMALLLIADLAWGVVSTVWSVASPDSPPAVEIGGVPGQE